MLTKLKKKKFLYQRKLQRVSYPGKRSEEKSLSDIRVQNTKSNLITALLSCLEDKSVHELKVKDIIDKAGVSTRTF